MEKSIYEQLNEIDDNESLHEESARAKLKSAFPELNLGDDSDNNSVEDSEPKTIDQTARIKSPLDLADEYVPTADELKGLAGLSINEMIKKLEDLKSQKWSEFHEEQRRLRKEEEEKNYPHLDSRTVRQKLNDTFGWDL
jgi:hypothetical protein